MSAARAGGAGGRRGQAVFAAEAVGAFRRTSVGRLSGDGSLTVHLLSLN